MKTALVLVSAGKHPVTGAARRNDSDARALEMALRVPDLQVTVFHAGSPGEPALRYYAGMGPTRIRVCPLPAPGNVACAIEQYVRSARPDLVLAGNCSDDLLAQGMLPYALMQRLGWPLLPDVCALAWENGAFRITTAPATDQRLTYVTSAGVILTAGTAAPAARQFAVGKARRTPVEAVAAGQAIQEYAASPWETIPARPAARRLRRFSQDACAADIVSALMMSSRRTERPAATPPAEGAARLISYLRQHGLVPPP